MSHITAESIYLHYPIYGANTRSLKRHFLNVTTGGYFQESEKAVIVNALHDLSFDLKVGDRLALMGHNGAGKSTLLRVLAGVYQPTFGKLNVQGRVGSMLDLGFGMEPEASGYENIQIRSLLLGISKKQLKQLIPEIEEFTEMGNYLSMPVKTYSSGMTVRLAFAMSTAFPSDILLIDETMGAGDAHFLEKARLRLENLINQTDILVFASHSTAALRQFCNKAFLLEHGRLKAVGDIDSVINVYERSNTTA